MKLVWIWILTIETCAVQRNNISEMKLVWIWVWNCLWSPGKKLSLHQCSTCGHYKAYLHMDLVFRNILLKVPSWCNTMTKWHLQPCTVDLNNSNSVAGQKWQCKVTQHLQFIQVCTLLFVILLGMVIYYLPPPPTPPHPILIQTA